MTQRQKTPPLHLYVLLGSLILTGCMTSPPIPDEQRPPHWGQELAHTENFYQVSPSVFRSEQPQDEIIPLLKQHQIDVIINLRARNQDPDIFQGQPFEVVHIPINTWSIDREDLLEVMKTIQRAESQNKRVLIHCYHGSDRTGASIAMYRVIFENWSVQDAITEMKHGGYGFHPIWINIEKIFTPENIKWIREQLPNPSY